MSTQPQPLSSATPPGMAAELISTEHQQQTLRTRARLLALPRNKQTDATRTTLQVVQFLVGDETYAFDAIFLREVYRMKEHTRIPGAPPHVLGVINVRGLMIALIDLHLLLGFPRKAIAGRDQVLVLHARGKEVGILSDGTLGMRALPIESIHPVPPMIPETRAAYLRGVTGEQVVIINVEKILFGHEGVT